MKSNELTGHYVRESTVNQGFRKGFTVILTNCKTDGTVRVALVRVASRREPCVAENLTLSICRATAESLRPS